MKIIFLLGLAGFVLSLLGGMSRQYDLDDDLDEWLEDNDSNQYIW
jgi:hypothetical protein